MPAPALLQSRHPQSEAGHFIRRAKMTDIDTGLNVWQMTRNHNRMIELQADQSPARDGPVELAFYGSSAFRITSPRGVSILIDPWRNHPSRKWDWYFHDFPLTAVDVGLSTHAHFDRTLGWIARVKPRQSILTHLSTGMDYRTLAALCPPGVEPGYDGMTVNLAPSGAT